MAANDSGDQAKINAAYDAANKAMEDANPDGPLMVHALLSLNRLSKAA
jgi:hypothetical protein